MNRRSLLAAGAAAAAGWFSPGIVAAQVRYFDQAPSAEDLERALTPPAEPAPPAASAPLAPGSAVRGAPSMQRHGGMVPYFQRPTVGLMVNFAFNSADLTDEARYTLDILGRVILKLDRFRFRIEGHTDAVGSDAYNLTLSQRRAQSVIGYLVLGHRIEPDRLDGIGLGKRRPRLPADPYAAVNRRVEIANLGQWIHHPLLR